MDGDDVVARGREAIDRRDWLAAFEGLSAARPGTLRAADFADLATAAYLLCRHDDCVAAMQRAHQAYQAAGDVAAAVRSAFWLATILRQQGERAVANGWIARAERLAVELPAESVEHGYVEFARLMRDVFAGDLVAAARRAEQVVEIGRRHQDPNLVACGLMSCGRRAIHAGDVKAGFEFLDEAMVSIISGEVSPILAGIVLCSSIEACQELWEYGRVAEWTQALDAWCEEQSGLEMFTGTCALHKGQVRAMHGDLAGAAASFEDSIDRYIREGHARPLGYAYAELGKVLRLQGRYNEAGVALRKASESGWDPSAEQAMLDLARGDTASAAAAGRKMSVGARSPGIHAQWLSQAVELLLADGDIDGARPVVRELTELAARLNTVLFQAHAARSQAALALAVGDSGTAEQRSRRGLEMFVQGGNAFEAARTRLVLADCLDALGDRTASDRERAIAHRALEAMGAAASTHQLSTGIGGLTDRQIDVLRLVAAGQSNRDISRELNLSEKTVARHLSNIFVKLDVQSRTAAAAYAFAHGLAP